MAFSIPNNFVAGTTASSAEVNENFDDIGSVINGHGLNTNFIVPIGGIIAWAKSMTGVPTLPSNYLECNGSTISDSESPMNGQALPDINGTQRFIRGANSSGGTGGSDVHLHGQNATDQGDNIQSGTGVSEDSLDAFTDNASSLPSYIEMVWVMRIK